MGEKGGPGVGDEVQAKPPAPKLKCTLEGVEKFEKTGLITGAAPTAGNVPDGKRLTDWVEKDLKQGLPVKVVSGDRGYEDGDNPEYLASKGIHSALRLNKVRTAKKERNKEG